ncbi:hypothetical protein D9611_014416 [Ephemerocybe angulata]|uniref:Anaphase-promoting complex subunit 4 WD40 domain-containing protein n=1 Tax=Ephemerocybe angulata TaxID=980116 RepID=A0A8H5EZD2_9AGAR|nr:hypothetical protein D9611_014416 [Tulosesus angulatus]
MKTTACIRTMDCPNPVCTTFLPGDRHVAVGTKAGEILIFDVSSSSLIETVKAHTGTVWSLHVRKDGRALVSGSADKEVKFWDFEEKEGNEEITTVLVHVRTLKMTDDVLSPGWQISRGRSARFYGQGLSIKTPLKFFLSLYGHKLPVLDMDISDDSKLIVTCSADKNVKIWGLDLCYAGQVREGFPLLWTVGKDKMLKYWDGDKFEGIQKLEGHHGEIWALALSHFGTSSSLGLTTSRFEWWEKLDEPLFLEEEREKELEKLYENGVADSLNRSDAPIGSGVEGAPAGEEAEVSAVTKQTAETLMADQEMEAFKEYYEAMAKLAEDDALRMQPPPRNPVLAAYDLEPDA